MNVRVLTRADWHTQPWKNGGGITHELLRADDAQGVQWRISIAEVASDGPFSVFPGIDRQILMLEGRGFRLQFADGERQSINTVAEPFAFAGDRACDCTLLDGPVLDFNVMTRRADFRAQVSRVLLGDAPQVLPSIRPVRVLLVLNGAVQIRCETQTWRLGRHELLVWQGGPKTLTVQSTDAGALLVSVAIFPLA